MFANIIDDLSLFMNQESPTVVSDDFVNPLNLIDQSHRQYEEATATLDELNNEITRINEQQSIIEKNRADAMIELAFHIQTKEDLENKVKCLTESLQSMEFDFKKYRQMKSCKADLKTYERIKKTFLAYKNMLKIFFDFDNNAYPINQGYLYNKTTKKLAYFKFNAEEKTANEVAEYLWNKIMFVSDNHDKISG